MPITLSGKKYVLNNQAFKYRGNGISQVRTRDVLRLVVNFAAFTVNMDAMEI